MNVIAEYVGYYVIGVVLFGLVFNLIWKWMN